MEVTEEGLMKEFKKATGRSDYVNLAVAASQNGVQFYRKLKNIDKDHLQFWLARGKSFEDFADPRMSLGSIIALFVSMVVFIMTNIVSAYSHSSCFHEILASIFVIFCLLFLYVSMTVGKLVREKGQLSMLNSLLESAIKDQAT